MIDQQAQRHDRRGHGDHKVDVQAPAPGQDLGERAAEYQPERGATAGDRTEDPERCGPVGRPLERHRQQPQRRGCEQRAECPLERSGGHEHAEGLGQPADRRGDREPDQAGDQGPLAPEQITELAAQQQEAAERQRVGGDDPLPALGREISAFWAEGIAMVTIVASSTTISCATLSRARTAHRFGSRRVPSSTMSLSWQACDAAARRSNPGIP